VVDYYFKKNLFRGVKMSEVKTKKHEFQAEVKQLLDIVVHSLYTDREIFLRELVSNASDALEKLRYIKLTEKDLFDDNLPLEIDIKTEEDKIIITDFGVGMTREELIENLGTIAHSGSRKFVESLKKGDKVDENLIGQFGVGFYSVFMVADRVEVFTHGWRKDDEHLVWRSDGSGTYEIEETTGLRRGTRIVVYLKEAEKEYSGSERVQQVLNQYSSFVQFPIKLNGEQINKVEAIWLRNKNEITEEEYKDFYKFQADAFDEPLYTFHLKSDAPIDINSVLFVPRSNPEFLGFGRMDIGVSLYCRKVLIDSKPKGLLPDWLRFLKGVVDSADFPLNISRESMQDSKLARNLNKVITKRFLGFLEDKFKEDADGYRDFFKNFGNFLKEGAASDQNYREQLLELLMFESSKTGDDRMTSLKDYVTRMKEKQTEIYYVFGSTRNSIEKGPHLEAFVENDLEVLYLYQPIDEFLMNSIQQYDNKRIVSVDNADVSLESFVIESEEEVLPGEDAIALCDWMKQKLGDRVEDISVSKRLVKSPAVALNADERMTQNMRRIMKAINKEMGSEMKIKLEINPTHSLIKNLSELRKKDEELAKLITEQIYDNSLLAAGFMEDPRSIAGRNYQLLERLSTI